jgi:hypothetical protein
MYLWYLEKIWRKSAIPDTQKSVGNEFVSARRGPVGQMCRLLAVGPSCRRHVGDFPSQGAESLRNWERFLKTTASLSNLIPPCFFYPAKYRRFSVCLLSPGVSYPLVYGRLSNGRVFADVTLVRSNFFHFWYEQVTCHLQVGQEDCVRT